MLLYVVCHDDASERQARDMCARYSSSTCPMGRWVGGGGQAREVRAVPLRVDLPSPAHMAEVAAEARLDTAGDSGNGSSSSSSALVAAPLLRLRPFLCESAAFLDVWARRHVDAWESEDYVGLVTYSFEHKLAERYAHTFPYGDGDHRGRRPWTASDWARIARDASARSLDVQGLVEVRFYRENEADPEEHGELLSMSRAAELNHTRAFTAAWRALLEEEEELKGMNTGEDGGEERPGRRVRFHVSNWWVARPAALRGYLEECFLPATRALLRSSRGEGRRGGGSAEGASKPSLDALFCVDSRYRTTRQTAEDLRHRFARPCFTLHPFVFERLPWQYFWARGARVGRPRGALPHFQCVTDDENRKQNTYGSTS